MAHIDCPDCPDELDTRGAWSHLVNKHEWDKDKAVAHVRRQKSGDNGANGGDGRSNDEADAPNSDEITGETPDSPENSGNDSPTADPNAIEVCEEGEDKLEPEGFETDNNPEMEPPEEAELPPGTTPDDFEPDQQADEPEPEPEPDPEPTPEPEEADEEADDGDKSVLSQLRERASASDDDKADRDDGNANDDDERTTEDIIEDAPTEEKRERRRQLKESLEAATETDDDEPEPESESESNAEPTSHEGTTTEDTRETPDTPSNSGGNVSQIGPGLFMSPALTEYMVSKPFEEIGKASAWDGWALEPDEQAAMAELIEKYAEEQDIELTPEKQLLLGIAQILGGKGARYAAWKRQQGGEAHSHEGTTTEDTRETPDTPSNSGQPDQRPPADEPNASAEDSRETPDTPSNSADEATDPHTEAIVPNR